MFLHTTTLYKSKGIKMKMLSTVEEYHNYELRVRTMRVFDYYLKVSENRT